MKIAFGCAVCVFTVAVCVFLGWPYGRGKHLFRHFHPDTQRLLSIYAFHREIGLNAYVKDPIKVARRTPCDVSIASGKPSTHMPRFPGWPRPNVVANPLSKSYQRFSSLRREVENFLRVETNEKKFHFQFGNFFRILWESLHTSRRIWSFAFFVCSFRLDPSLRHIILDVFNLSCPSVLAATAIVRLSRSNFYYDSNNKNKNEKRK